MHTAELEYCRWKLRSGSVWTYRRSPVQHLVRPIMVRMQERRAALLVGQLRVDSEARADRIFPSHFLGRANMQCLRKLRARDRSNMDVAMQSGPADAICLNDDGVVRLIRHSHMSLPSKARTFCCASAKAAPI